MRFGECFKTPEVEGREKHTPVIEGPSAVGVGEFFDLEVIVGKEVPHPNKVEHHIKWVQIFARFDDGNVNHLATFDYAPTLTEPRSKVVLSLEKSATVFALAYCNIHGLWENSFSIKVG